MAAIKALAEGNPRPDQCVTALNFIIETLSAVYDEPFRPEGERETAYALGRAYVGRQIRKCITQPFEELAGKQARVSKEQE